MNRRHAHGRPTPSLTPDRDEGVRCHLRREWLDELLTTTPDPEIIEAAQHACGSCVLRVECWGNEENRAWVDVLTGKKVPRVPKRKTKRSVAWAARAAQRIAVMEKHAAAGSSVEEVAAALGITPTSVYTWCVKHGVTDLFHQFEGARGVLEARRERHKARREDAA